MRVSEFNAVHPLAAAVRRQLGSPSIPETLETLSDVRRGGADGGFSGFVYYADTIRFARRHREEIVASLISDADDFGMGKGIAGAVQLVSGFRCVSRDVSPHFLSDAVYAALAGGRARAGVSPDEIETVLNGVAWYALETVAHSAESLTP